MSEQCYHCGDEVIGKGILFDDKSFCCNGCKSVYELLSQSDLGNFYAIENKPGIKPENANVHKYAFLEVENIQKKFIDFEEDHVAHVTLHLPKIHCSSCIYLLENLHKLNDAVSSAQVNFTARTATIIFNKEQLSFSDLALLLDRIGYAPNFGNREQLRKKRSYSLLYKLGVAGFAFGSIMLWTFPEYLGVEADNPEFRSFTSYLSFVVSIPVILYSANEYLISAYKAIRFKSINLDVPISIGIIALYVQSCFQIFTDQGPGYMDSFAGFVFFLLIGKWFQNKTYDSLSFERDYTSYFPVAVTRVSEIGDEIIEIENIQVGDCIMIRNEEVIPCDVELVSLNTRIDYSFVTGESAPVVKKTGDFVYAGGKLLGKACEFKVLKKSSRSHLTRLWNEAGSEKNSKNEHQSDKLSLIFLLGVLVIAFASAIVWSFLDISRTTEIVVSILIVACPCALALSRPFTYGNIMRLMGRKGLYLKNSLVIEKMENVDTIVFDKTGTLTGGNYEGIRYHGRPLSDTDTLAVILLTNSSTHPISRSITSYLRGSMDNSISIEVNEFEEHSGEGVCGWIGESKVMIGTPDFIGFPEQKVDNETATHLVINSEYCGKFTFESELRPGINDLLDELQAQYEIHVLSGDKNKDLGLLLDHIKEPANIRFEQTPSDKYEYIKNLRAIGRKVLMVGDGLNDSGALEIADVGIAVSEDIFRFTPSSDAIIKATMLRNLGYFLNRSKFARTVLYICFTFSILYNAIGLGFAISGNLTPLIAAILMPISSITVVFLSTFLVLSRR